MISKERLNEIMLKEQNIKTKLEQIKILKNMVTNCNHPFDNMPKANGKEDKMASTICKIIDLEREIEAETARLTLIKIQMLDLISMIGVFEQQTVLLKRYFEAQNWEDIAYAMHYSTRWVHVLHSRALINLDRILAEKEFT